MPAHLLEVVLLADDRALAHARVGLAGDGVAVRVAGGVVAAGEVVDLWRFGGPGGEMGRVGS